MFGFALQHKTRFLFTIIGVTIVILFSLCDASYARTAEKSQSKPVINWSPNLFSINGAQQTSRIVSESVNKTIVGMLSAHIHAQLKTGMLPFDVKEIDDSNSFAHTADNPIGIIALVVDDNTIDSQYNFNGVTYYKEFVLCGIDVMFCSADSADGSMRVLHTIPLRGYDVLGGDFNNPITSPITMEQRQAMFINIANHIINTQLDFAKQRQALQEIDARKVLTETYQVTDVEISSAKACEIFGDNQDKVKSLLGGIFTSAYQKTTNKIVYPSLVGGKWKADATQELWALEMNSPSSSLTLKMNRAKYPIKLDLTGLAVGNIPTKHASNVKTDLGYKAWLKKTPVMGKEQAEMTKMSTRQVSKRNPTSILLNEDDVFVELLIGLATDLASQKE